MVGGVFPWRDYQTSACPLRRNKWGCYANQCAFVIFIIVILFLSLRVLSVKLLSSLFYFIVFWLWSAFACCVGSSWAQSSSLHSQQQACCGEGWNLNILLFHTLLFRKKVAPPPDPRLQPESCLLLQPTPTRGGQKARVSSRTNTYILVDSGLRVRISSDTKLCNQKFC